MTFSDYFITLFFDGSIMFDTELTAEKLEIKEGDTFVAKLNEAGTVILEKQKDGQHSRINQ